MSLGRFLWGIKAGLGRTKLRPCFCLINLRRQNPDRQAQGFLHRLQYTAGATHFCWTRAGAQGSLSMLPLALKHGARLAG